MAHKNVLSCPHPYHLSLSLSLTHIHTHSLSLSNIATKTNQRGLNQDKTLCFMNIRYRKINPMSCVPQEFKVVFVCWLLNVPATGECISGMDLLRQFDVLPHWDRSCRSNVLPHPVTVYWHRSDQSQCWPYNARCLAGWPLECQFLSHWYDSTGKKSWRKRDSNLGSSALEADALPLGQRGGQEFKDRGVYWQLAFYTHLKAKHSQRNKGESIAPLTPNTALCQPFTWVYWPLDPSQLFKISTVAPMVEVVCWLLNIAATCLCISEEDLLRLLHVVSHWDSSGRLTVSLSHSILTSGQPLQVLTLLRLVAWQGSHWSTNS